MWISNGGWAQTDSAVGFGWTQAFICGERAGKGLTHGWQWLLAVGWFSSVRALILQQASLGSFTSWSQVSSCSKRSQAQVLVKFLLASCLLLTPWPKQSVWKDQDTGKLTYPGHDQNNLPHRRCPELTSLLRTKSFRVIFPLWCNLPFLIQFNKHILWGYWDVECVILLN